MDRAARRAALGISDLGRKRPPIEDYLEEAKRELKGSKLHIFTKLNGQGEIINYTLKRVVDGRWIHLGQSASAQGIYRLAMRCLRTTPARTAETAEA